jgi:hypothetical protein
VLQRCRNRPGKQAPVRIPPARPRSPGLPPRSIGRARWRGRGVRRRGVGPWCGGRRRLSRPERAPVRAFQTAAAASTAGSAVRVANPVQARLAADPAAVAGPLRAAGRGLGLHRVDGAGDRRPQLRVVNRTNAGNPAPGVAGSASTSTTSGHWSGCSPGSRPITRASTAFATTRSRCKVPCTKVSSLPPHKLLEPGRSPRSTAPSTPGPRPHTDRPDRARWTPAAPPATPPPTERSCSAAPRSTTLPTGGLPSLPARPPPAGPSMTAPAPAPRPPRPDCSSTAAGSTPQGRE